MSCLRSEEAFSICSSSAKAKSSAGVFRFSSWRFMDLCIARGREEIWTGLWKVARTEPGGRDRISEYIGKCERKPAGGVAVPLPTGDMQGCRYYKGLGSKR